MTNNDILRRLRYTFDLNDTKMMSLFSTEEKMATRAQISAWLKKADDEDLKNCSDKQFAIFLNGFIAMKRGVREGAPKREPEKRLNNNLIFNKLKIALDMKTEDVLEILESTDMIISKHELSAFFRKAGHKNYRDCNDQILRKFLQGLQQKLRPTSEEKTASVWPTTR